MKSAWGMMISMVAALVGLAACSDSDGSASTSLDTDATSIATAVSTSTPTSTTSAVTTPTTGTSAATTAPPATSTIPAEAQVKDDYLRLYDAYWVCLRSPASCDPSTLTASIGPARAALTKTVNDLVAGGLFVGPDDPGYVVVESATLSGPTTASVISCWWDTGVIYGPPATAGGDPVVVNDLQATSRFETTMALEDGEWLTSEEKRTDRVEGENQCAPEG